MLNTLAGIIASAGGAPAPVVRSSFDCLVVAGGGGVGYRGGAGAGG